MSLVMVAGSLGNVFFVMAVAQLFGEFGPRSFFPAVLAVLGLTAAASAVISGTQQQRPQQEQLQEQEQGQDERRQPSKTKDGGSVAAAP
eukprot:SAG11_NODE_32_length_22830_cov_17.507941_7_plen_89_part_00